MRVKELMTAKPSYCEPYWTVETVASLMDHVGTGVVPVIEDVLNRKVIGVVTDRDLCVRVVGPGLYPAHTWVRDCMTPNPICCRAEDDVETALRQMRDKRIRRLPVVDEHMQLQGMLSISDFVRSETADTAAVYGALHRICQPQEESGMHEKPVLRVA